MPPHEYEELKFFIKSADGGLVPFDEIQLINLNADYSHEYPCPFSTLPSEMSMTFKLTHKSERRMRKQVHAIISKTKRMRRSTKRHKEKERRKTLKGGFV